MIYHSSTSATRCYRASARHTLAPSTRDAREHLKLLACRLLNDLGPQHEQHHDVIALLCDALGLGSGGCVAARRHLELLASGRWLISSFRTSSYMMLPRACAMHRGSSPGDAREHLVPPACWLLDDAGLQRERQRDDLAVLLDGFGHGILVVYERSPLAGRVALCCRAPAQLIVFDELWGAKPSSSWCCANGSPQAEGHLAMGL